MKRYTTFAIVGSHELSHVPRSLIEWMSAFPPDSMVRLRSPRLAEPGVFESLVAGVCKELMIPYGWMKPGEGGRSATYERDISMVAGSDCVLAFFADDQMSGGTEHVVEKAIDQFIPVYSFGYRDLDLVMLGCHDPYDAWGRFTL